MSSDGRTIFVYADDPTGTISVEDISQWFSLVGEIAEVKMQFDVGRKALCYCVVFKNLNDAYLAASNLNEKKFKNCLITIKSKVYNSSNSKREEDFKADGPASEHKRSSLPYNTCVPLHFRMSPALVDYIDQVGEDYVFLDHKETWNTLKSLQKSWFIANEELSKVTVELQNRTGSVATTC